MDQNFNGKDWKAVKSEYLKRRYKNMNEARDGVNEMLSLLGDRYTRYLTPGVYAGLLSPNTSDLLTTEGLALPCAIALPV